MAKIMMVEDAGVGLGLRLRRRDTRTVDVPIQKLRKKLGWEGGNSNRVQAGLSAGGGKMSFRQKALLLALALFLAAFDAGIFLAAQIAFQRSLCGGAGTVAERALFYNRVHDPRSLRHRTAVVRRRGPRLGVALLGLRGLLPGKDASPPQPLWGRRLSLRLIESDIGASTGTGRPGRASAALRRAPPTSGRCQSARSAMRAKDASAASSV